MRTDAGFVLMVFVLFIAITAAASFALIPSMDREDVIELQRLREDQARAAAEGAVALALHRDGDIAAMDVGRATVTATLTRKGSSRRATAHGHPVSSCRPRPLTRVALHPGG